MIDNNNKKTSALMQRLLEIQAQAEARKKGIPYVKPTIEMTEQETKKQIAEEAKNTIKPFLGFCSFMMLMGLFALCASPFVWIWGTIGLAAKVFFTGVALIAVFKFLHMVFTKSADSFSK